MIWCRDNVRLVAKWKSRMLMWIVWVGDRLVCTIAAVDDDVCVCGYTLVATVTCKLNNGGGNILWYDLGNKVMVEFDAVG